MKLDAFIIRMLADSGCTSEIIAKAAEAIAHLPEPPPPQYEKSTALRKARNQRYYTNKKLKHSDS